MQKRSRAIRLFESWRCRYETFCNIRVCMDTKHLAWQSQDVKRLTPTTCAKTVAVKTTPTLTLLSSSFFNSTVSFCFYGCFKEQRLSLVVTRQKQRLFKFIVRTRPRLHSHFCSRQFLIPRFCFVSLAAWRPTPITCSHRQKKRIVCFYRADSRTRPTFLHLGKFWGWVYFFWLFTLAFYSPHTQKQTKLNDTKMARWICAALFWFLITFIRIPLQQRTNVRRCKKKWWALCLL